VVCLVVVLTVGKKTTNVKKLQIPEPQVQINYSVLELVTYIFFVPSPSEASLSVEGHVELLSFQPLSCCVLVGAHQSALNYYIS
jgi:hypothetical protein